jgi:2-C-methyl-D-erythritol 4-phosphate cytidylyltransferase
MNARYWAVIPAAGVGSRMSAGTAKQYLPLLNKTVIEWSLAPFIEDPRIEAIVVVIAASDTQWRALPIAHHPKLRVAIGGADRAASVRAGLALLHQQALAEATADATGENWVLVHDAARPCLTRSDLSALIAAMQNESVGGLLATPLADTLKQADAGQHVARTIARSGLWRALTPQMFRFAILQRALEQALAAGLEVTDDASAIEALGLKPRLVVGRADNLKITVPEDLDSAARILATRT